MKEQDLLRRLEKFPGENPDIGVDCELRLGLSYSRPNPPQSQTNYRKIIYDSPPPPPSPPAQVMGNYGMVNGNYGVMMNPRGASMNNGWGVNGSNQLTWLPAMVNHPSNNGNRRDGFSYYVGSSSASGSNNPTVMNDFRRYAGAGAGAGGLLPIQMQRNNVTVMNNIIQMIPQPERPVAVGPVKRCAACETSTTPLWRNGPKGSKSLCNACGIRYKKEEKKASGSTDSPQKSKVGGSAKGRDSTKKPKF
ncbi:PREDICTED: white collar 2 protein-like [Nelumbo nucifera]|uniref:White collar 2 protein-like n=2 Tax=Nelumbo nucifera TaxID=4432 RepID=A0A1U8Q8F1_NELNU|nr:PREDICTED: white collar 2 protein-like [Nelumbo nucifera]XP_019054321.1 PREDICTED: white collar 2 protein-like [Nelumbo nucifera]XP_019054322.1 PREDICTED: white collar 2 protein-like [Nelumbo nucifera]XP_019054323.1 PREDICTED: white collar 2 protein-like [Nelumbo nucifera]DAD30000.1 TPA_asm: hypothetical protein HUJ06_031468 [Nelumbo nucifera]